MAATTAGKLMTSENAMFAIKQKKNVVSLDRKSFINCKVNGIVFNVESVG